MSDEREHDEHADFIVTAAQCGFGRSHTMREYDCKVLGLDVERWKDYTISELAILLPPDDMKAVLGQLADMKQRLANDAQAEANGTTDEAWQSTQAGIETVNAGQNERLAFDRLRTMHNANIDTRLLAWMRELITIDSEGRTTDAKVKILDGSITSLQDLIDLGNSLSTNQTS